MDYTYQIRVRRGTTAQWSLANPILADGEPGYLTDTNHYKIGDGVTRWDDLPISTGFPGQDATILIGDTTTGVPGTDANVVNVGSLTESIFEFTIPEGMPGKDLEVHEGDSQDPIAEWDPKQLLWDPDAIEAAPVGEAPVDGLPYARKDADWSEVVGGGGGIGEAPVDGLQYARQDSDWSEVVGGSGDVEEAPVDGLPYARQDAGWVLAGAGGGVTDHGALTGLGDDDHAIYHTNARGDARYDSLGSAVAAQSAAGVYTDSRIWMGTQAEYDNLGTWDADVMYVVTG